MFLQFYDADANDIETIPNVICLQVLSDNELSFSYLDALGCVQIGDYFLDEDDYFKVLNLNF